MSDISKTISVDSHNVVERLIKCLPNKGEIAMLRRSVSRQEIGAYQIIFPCLTNDHNRKHAEDVALLVGGCFSLHKNHNSEIGNMGESLKKWYYERGESESSKKKAMMLICSNRPSMSNHLTRFVSEMASLSIPINFEILYKDVYFWGSSVQRRWASSFFANMFENNERTE